MKPLRCWWCMNQLFPTFNQAKNTKKSFYGKSISLFIFNWKSYTFDSMDLNTLFVKMILDKFPLMLQHLDILFLMFQEIYKKSSLIKNHWDLSRKKPIKECNQKTTSLSKRHKKSYDFPYCTKFFLDFFPFLIFICLMMKNEILFQLFEI